MFEKPVALLARAIVLAAALSSSAHSQSTPPNADQVQEFLDAFESFTIHESARGHRFETYLIAKRAVLVQTAGGFVDLGSSDRAVLESSLHEDQLAANVMAPYWIEAFEIANSPQPDSARIAQLVEGAIEAEQELLAQHYEGVMSELSQTAQQQLRQDAESWLATETVTRVNLTALATQYPDLFGLYFKDQLGDLLSMYGLRPGIQTDPANPTSAGGSEK